MQVPHTKVHEIPDQLTKKVTANSRWKRRELQIKKSRTECKK
jgi:hypothetical protein